MEKIEGIFVKDKETKGTWRYATEDSGGRPIPVTTIYVRKWALGTPYPDKIRLTIEEVE